MKRFALCVVAVLVGLIVLAQEKNGEIYKDHPYLEKVDLLWEAMENGDKEAFGELLDEKAVGYFNGNKNNPRKRENLINGVDWWKDNFEGLEIVVDEPAYADVMEYKDGGIWVQDWLRFKAVHKESGIRINSAEHHLYSFNEEGKITSIHFYFDSNIFRALNENTKTHENGKVYDAHPHIVRVRKLINAYCDEDLEAMSAHYSPKVVFSDLTKKWGETSTLEDAKKVWAERFEMMEDIEMEQVGYPDCVYYERNDAYTVYSWWIHKAKVSETGEVSELPMMLSHTFDKEGKIVRGMAYFSSNHIEE